MTLKAMFDDLVVLEWGKRPAIRACGDLLAQVGATVLVFEDTMGPKALARFKTGLADTEKAHTDAFAQANVVLMSSDRRDESAPPPRRADQIFLDITVDETGSHGHWTEPLLQAVAGIADITGTKDTPPTICDAPIVEFQGAIFAAAGVLTAWPRLIASGDGQNITLSLVDCALNSLSSFLPLVFAGKTPRRSGNRHPMAVPWNSYKASDGWILLCSATDEHWARLCLLIGREELSKGRFEKLADRVVHCEAVDAEVEAWTSILSVKDCIAALNGAGLAAGPILTLEELAQEPNLIHRGSISQGSLPAPLSFLKMVQGQPKSRDAVPPAWIPAQPLTGMRVVEIGQYTTAPLAAKQLALLGAEVIKIEPPGGEASRAWPPHQDGQGYFFTMNNANKRSCLLDLRQDADRETFARLLKRSDVLIENMKPGSLEKLGFGWEKLAQLNPQLVYCGISGFGKDSAYPGRPAFDAVVQAMSGLMDVTRAGGIPVKLGISASDVIAGIGGLFAVMCGLEQRRRMNYGAMIDLSMQDVSVWATQTLWNSSVAEANTVATCTDGFIVAACGRGLVETVAGGGALLSRDELIERLASAGITAGPIRTLDEIAQDPCHVGGGVIQIYTDESGKSWPLFKCPYRFSKEKTSEIVPIGALGEANDYIVDLCYAKSNTEWHRGYPTAGDRISAEFNYEN
jgi:crotonobetainyl-CoA:carnitine CoA-transferase CaiB-like acyl-CoA transferase